MKECISCGNVQITNSKCNICGSSLIPALSKEHAEKEYYQELHTLGVKAPDSHICLFVHAITDK